MASRGATRHAIFWIVMAGFALLIWVVVRSNTGERIREVTLTQFMDEVDRDNVRQVTLTASDDSGMLNVLGILRKNDERFSSTVPQNYPDLYRTLREKKVEVILHSENGRTWLTWLVYYLPSAVFLGMWLYFMRQIRDGLQELRPQPGPAAPGPLEK